MTDKLILPDLDFVNLKASTTKEQKEWVYTLLSFCYTRGEGGSDSRSCKISSAEWKELNNGKYTLPKIRELAIQNGLIDFDECFVIGKKCYRYYIQSYQNLTWKTITSKNVCDFIKRWREKDGYYARKSKIHQYLHKCLSLLDIDEQKAYEYVDTINYADLKEDNKKKIDKGIYSLDDYKNKSKQSISRIRLLKNLKHSSITNLTKVCFFGHRFHTPITNIPTKAREYVSSNKYNDYYNVDVSNSQVFFLLCIISIADNQSINTNQIINTLQTDRRGRYKRERITSLLTTLVKEGEKERISIGKTKTYDNERRRFRRLVLDGQIYEYLAEQTNITRDKAKGQMFSDVLFGPTRKYETTFAKCFPQIQGWIDGEKANGKDKEKPYRVISQVCQRLESYCMYQIIMPQIQKEIGIIPLATIHDSILAPRDYAKKIQMIMETSLKDTLGMAPTIKIKSAGS